MIPSSMVQRYNKYQEYSLKQKNIYGNYWTKEGKLFDISLNEDGYTNKGKRNYFPSKYKEDFDHNILKLNYSTENDFKRSKVFKTDLYCNINDKKFCNIINEGNHHLLQSNYWLDLIFSKMLKKPNKVIEIGAGCGLFTAILKDEFDCKNIIIDIPLTLNCSIAFLMDTFPEKKFLLPNEVKADTSFENYDFIFLIPEQINMLNDYKADFIVNTESFMEMDYSEIEKYFKFINESLTDGGYFFCSNRVRKINKFFDYPWHILKSFKKIFLKKNEINETIDARAPTLLDYLLIKNEKKEYKANNLNIFEKIYFRNSYKLNERIDWLKKDIKKFVKKIFFISN